MRNSHSHQRVSGLLNSSSVSSHWCPVVPTCAPGARPFASTRASQTQKAIESSVMIEM